MPAWFWLNMPACVLFFLATAGIPLWVVLKWPDFPNERTGVDHPAPTVPPPSPARADRARVPEHVR